MISVDRIACYLEVLQKAGVPVLWRPLHESNGGFFWWGGRPGANGTQQLFRETFERMTRVDHLHNLLWVWDQNVPGGRFADYFPGQRYVDAFACDNYGDLVAPYYKSMLKLAAGKPVALGEVGKPPMPELLKRQPKWIWFVSWADMVSSEIKPTYDDPRTITRNDGRLRE